MRPPDERIPEVKEMHDLLLTAVGGGTSAAAAGRRWWRGAIYWRAIRPAAKGGLGLLPLAAAELANRMAEESLLEFRTVRKRTATPDPGSTPVQDPAPPHEPDPVEGAAHG